MLQKATEIKAHIPWLFPFRVSRCVIPGHYFTNSISLPKRRALRLSDDDVAMLGADGLVHDE